MIKNKEKKRKMIVMMKKIIYLARSHNLTQSKIKNKKKIDIIKIKEKIKLNSKLAKNKFYNRIKIIIETKTKT